MLYIYEPAMCCPTGLCGVGIDEELLRISAVLSLLEENGIKVERFNLSSSPQEFVKNKEINELIMEKGIEILPVTLVEGKIVKTGSYPNNEELKNFLDVPTSFVERGKTVEGVPADKNGECCPGGNCCS